MIAAAFLTSAMGVEKNPEIGRQAPKIETIEGTNVVDGANSEGKTKVISFWSPKNAASRIANRNLSLKYGDTASDIDFISICTDSDEKLMQEVMKIDGINEEKNYSYSSIAPRVFKDYRAESNPKAYMVSGDGKILQIM